MSTFLERILEQKKREIEQLYSGHFHSHYKTPTKDKVQSEAASFVSAVAHPGRLSVIAEIKRASPSKGVINEQFDILERAEAYEKGGAAAISVLTDEPNFHGSISDLERVRNGTHIPVLRKDFIIDPIQVEQSCLAGASAILLIAAAVTSDRLAQLSACAKSAGLDVLIEVHTQNEVEAALAAKPSVLGINNRNLHTFEVSLDTTVNILSTLPRVCPVISESGFHVIDDIQKVARYGIDGILVGESLMRKTSESELKKTIAEFSNCVFAPDESGCEV